MHKLVLGGTIFAMIFVLFLPTSTSSANSYSCGGSAVGSVTCGGFSGTIHCNITGLLQGGNCTDAYGHSVYCSSNFLSGSMNVDCPLFPNPTPTPSPTRSSTFTFANPTPTPSPTRSSTFTFTNPTPSASSPIAPVTSCTAPPNAPSVIVTQASATQGPSFSIIPSSSGAATSTVGYALTYYSVLTASWGSWTNPSTFVNFNGVPIAVTPVVTAGQSRVALNTWSINPCGASSIAWDSPDQKGTALFGVPTKMQQLSVNTGEYANGVPLGNDVLNLGSLVSQSYATTLYATSTTPNICTVSGTSIINTISIGECDLEITSPSTGEIEGASTSISFNVVSNSQILINDQTQQSQSQNVVALYCIHGGQSDGICGNSPNSLEYTTCSASMTASLYYEQGKTWVKLGSYKSSPAPEICSANEPYLFDVMQNTNHLNLVQAKFKMVFNVAKSKKVLNDFFNIEVSRG